MAPNFEFHPEESPKKRKPIKSAYNSESFDADGTIHVDGLVGSATISPSGRDVALASPDGLAIIDLDSPWSPPRRLSSHGLPWLVVDVQWSPFAARDYWVASTANHRCLVWNLHLRNDSPKGAIEHSLQAHSRAITDINFSAHHPDFLATCAVDGYVHCWDLRRPRQPSLTFCDWFSGATQVKYNRQDPHILASSHDRWLHIWDNRKAAEPLKTISAHTSKIYGLDWNRTRSTGLVTCSLDKSIKFWDYSQRCEVPERVIRTDFPVWRARHTPFGRGLLAMPQNEPGNLYLYDQDTAPHVPLDGAVSPVAVFEGHGNHKVKEFLWRSRGGVGTDNADNREFQLVSWGEDNELRLRTVEPRLLESVGYVRGTTIRKNLIITRKGATYRTFRNVDDTVQLDRRSATMSDPRPGSGGQYRASALSRGLYSHMRRVGPTWRNTSMTAKTNSGKTMDKSQLQIGWMKGITMSKRKPTPGNAMRSGSKDLTMFSPGYEDSWAEPETIQDEFLRISNKLPNVKWENIDMDALLLNASLKGPWGVNREITFIKVKVDIPAGYPKAKAPKFIVEKSSFVPDETHKKIEEELQELASRFLQRKQNCLEHAFTYLLGETDLESSTSFFKNVRDLDDELDALADESSSEDDDHDIPTGGSASMSQELTGSAELDPTAALATAQRAVAPFPRLCGARFSNDGKLVCFFPTKEEKERTRAELAGPSADVARERPKGEPNFAGFGRLTSHPLPPKRRFHDDTSATEEVSEDSGGSDSTSSSDSEPTTVHKILWYQTGQSIRKSWSGNDSVRSSGGGTGAGTGTGTGTSRKRAGKPKNTISIHDLRAELPSKRQFAQEYAIFGDGADVCAHNAAVAEKYGHSDLVVVWNYASLLLQKNIPLEVYLQRQWGESVLVIAKDAVARVREEDGDGSQVTAIETGLTGRVRWGFHPLAQELIDDLFQYFEQIADIQMLAMLSCIFGDSIAEDSVAYAESHITQPQTPLPMKAPSFSLEYFPSDPAVWSFEYGSRAGSAITTPKIAHTPALYSSSQESEELAALLNANSIPFLGPMGLDTPPKGGREQLRDTDQSQSLSTSPSNRLLQRSNSSVAAAIAASLPRALAGIVSGSPPEPPRKRPSPAETLLSNFAPTGMTWGAASSVFGTGPDTPGTARTSLSDDEEQEDELVSMIPVGVSCLPKNQGRFDDDGWMSTPLLDVNRSELYSSYRYAYAEMLQMWGQPLSRLEIMKFNVLMEDAASRYMNRGPRRGSTAVSASSSGGAMKSLNDPFSGRKELLRELHDSGRGLDVRGICRVHEVQLEPLDYMRANSLGGVVGFCQRCERRWGEKRPQSKLRCVYCRQPITTLYAGCLGCGCASHEACLAEWHAMGENLCPTGDECNCVEEASNGQVESWQALQAAMAAAEKARRESKRRHSRKEGVKQKKKHGMFSIPQGFNKLAIELHESGSSEEAEAREGEDVDSAYASQGSTSWDFVGGKPPPTGDEPISAARLSLGNRLKKSLGESGRPSMARRKSGGAGVWKGVGL